MISVEEAKALVIKTSFQLPAIEKGISDCLNYILSEDVVSPIFYPPFDQSAMDGFAIMSDDLQKQFPLEITGESAAGVPFDGTLKPGQAVRIFTGAMVPSGADTIVVQEKVLVEKGKLIVREKLLERKANIRHRGSQINKGDIILKKGQVINPATIGLLASLGIVIVRVFSSPKVTLVVTGNELCKPGTPLKDGQVYESNSYCIRTALESVNCAQVEIVSVGDDEKQTVEKLKSAIEKSDIILVTGGISVGKYDFVGKAIAQLGTQNIFYKIAQKPGKPLFFGRHDKCLVFGLPGNPAAALSCFYEYVLTTIKIMQGRSDIFLSKQRMPIAVGIPKKEGLALFLKGKVCDGKVEVLPGQESNNISSFSAANCLIYLPSEKGEISAEEPVEIHLLP